MPKCDFCLKEVERLAGEWVNWEVGERYYLCKDCVNKIKELGK